MYEERDSSKKGQEGTADERKDSVSTYDSDDKRRTGGRITSVTADLLG